jgi:hypothetical protein
MQGAQQSKSAPQGAQAAAKPGRAATQAAARAGKGKGKGKAAQSESETEEDEADQQAAKENDQAGGSSDEEGYDSE